LRCPASLSLSLSLVFAGGRLRRANGGEAGMRRRAHEIGRAVPSHVICPLRDVTILDVGKNGDI